MERRKPKRKYGRKLSKEYRGLGMETGRGKRGEQEDQKEEGGRGEGGFIITRGPQRVSWALGEESEVVHLVCL